MNTSSAGIARRSKVGSIGAHPGGEAASVPLHENWERLIAYCQEMEFGSIRLSIANGLPVSGEEVVPTLRFDKTGPVRLPRQG